MMLENTFVRMSQTLVVGSSGRSLSNNDTSVYAKRLMNLIAGRA